MIVCAVTVPVTSLPLNQIVALVVPDVVKATLTCVGTSLGIVEIDVAMSPTLLIRTRILPSSAFAKRMIGSLAPPS